MIHAQSNNENPLTTPTSPETSAPVRAISIALAWTLLAAGLLTAAAAVYIGIRAYTPVLFADEWGVPMDYMILNGHYGLAKLWAQHNEHRIPFQNILQLADMLWWKTDHRPLLMLGWTIQAAQCCAFAYFLRRTAKLTLAEWVTGLGLIAFCLLNPIQMQIFEWAFSPSFLGAFFCALMSIGALALYAAPNGQSHVRGQSSVWLFLAIVCAFLAECNLASGVLVWAMLPVCALLLRVPARVVALLAACGCAGIGIYLIGYRSPANATSPLDAIRHPVDVALFVRAYFAESWRHLAPAMGDPAAAIAIAAMLLAAIYYLVLRRRVGEPAEAFVLSLIWMALSTAFLTALGRQISGVAQAREGRYQVAAMLFWCGIGIWLILMTRRLGRLRAHALIVLQVVFLGAAVSESTAVPKLLRQYSTDGYVRSLAGISIEAGIFDDPILRFIYPDPRAVPPTYRYLLAHRWMEPPFPEYRAVGKKLEELFAVSSGENCVGSVDSVRVVAGDSQGIRQLVANGWVYSESRHTAVRNVVAVDDDEEIIGIGIGGGERGDIPSVFPSIRSGYTGWGLYAVCPSHAKRLFVYAVMPDTKRVCLVGQAKPVQ
jgi:hypothetical protein